MKIYVTGISGTGKTSIVQKLNERGIKAVDVDDELCEWTNKDTLEEVKWAPGRDDAWYEAHEWTCDIDRLGQILAEYTDVVIAGAAANQDKYLSFFDKVYFLNGDLKLLIARIQSRTDNDFGKHPTEQRRMAEWQDQYVREMGDRGATALDVSEPLEKLVDIIASNFEYRPRRPVR